MPLTRKLKTWGIPERLSTSVRKLGSQAAGAHCLSVIGRRLRRFRAAAKLKSHFVEYNYLENFTNFPWGWDEFSTNEFCVPFSIWLLKTHIAMVEDLILKHKKVLKFEKKSFT